MAGKDFFTDVFGHERYFIILDASGRVYSCSPNWSERLGFPKEEFLIHNLITLVEDSARDRFRLELLELQSVKTITGRRFGVVGKDELAVAFNYSLYFNPSSGRIFLLADETAVENEREFKPDSVFKTLFESADVAYVLLDPLGIVLDFNARARDAYKDYSGNSLHIGGNIRSVLGEYHLKSLDAHLSAAMRGEGFSGVRNVRDTHGREYSVSVTYQPLWTDNKVTRILLTTRELQTDQQERSRLRDLEVKWTALLDSMGEGIIIQDKEARIEFANRRAGEILDISRDDLIGRTNADDYWQPIREDGSYYHPGQHPSMVSLRTGKSVRGAVMGLRLDDHTVWIQINSRPLLSTTGVIEKVLTTFTDITEVIETKEELRRSLTAVKDYRDALNRTTQVAFTDARGNILECNEAFLRASGYRQSELVGKPLHSLRTAGQSSVAVEVMLSTLAHGRSYHQECRMRKKDGSTYWIDLFAHPLKKPGGELDRILVVCMPIDERKGVELARERYIRELTEFSFTTSHRLRKPLANILGLIGLLREDMLRDEQDREILEHLRPAAEELDTVIREMAERLYKDKQ